MLDYSLGVYMKNLMRLSIAVLLVSCAVSKTKLSDDGKKVKIIDYPGENCHALGKVVGINEEGIEELAQNHARNLAARLDANAIKIETVSNGNMVKANGIAYNCE